MPRSKLARLAGVSESGLRNVEVGKHNPTRRVVLALCRALGLPSPLPSAELRLPPGRMDHSTAIKILRAALAEYAAARADPDAYADRTGLTGTDRMLAVFEAIGQHDQAKQLIALLPQENEGT